MSKTKSVLIIDGNLVGDVTEQAVDDVVSVTADGQKTYGQLLNELRNSSKFDATKLSEYSYLDMEQHIYRYYCLVGWSDVFGGYDFFGVAGNSTDYEITNLVLHETNSTYSKVLNGTVIDVSAYSPVNGAIISLHYGSSSVKADFETHANKCMLSGGEDVETKINELEQSGGGVTKDLLYTNPDPLSAFAAKTMNFQGLSAYDLVEIVFRVDTGSTEYSSQFFDNSISYIQSANYHYVMTSSNFIAYQRRFTFNSDSIVFQGGYRIVFNTTNPKTTYGAAYDKGMMPYKIFGWKFG